MSCALCASLGDRHDPCAAPSRRSLAVAVSLTREHAHVEAPHSRGSIAPARPQVTKKGVSHKHPKHGNMNQRRGTQDERNTEDPTIPVPIHTEGV